MNGSAADPPAVPSGRRIAVILGLVQLLAWALTYYVPAIMTKEVAEGLGLSVGVVLGGFSLALVVTGLAAPVACRLIDRRGGRTVMVPAVLLQAAGLALLGTAGGAVGWYAGWAVCGLGMAGGLYDAAFATAGRALGAGARPTITGITLLGGFASSFGWPLGAVLVPVLGWRGVLLLYAGMLLAVNLPLLLCLPRGVPAGTAPVPARPEATGAARGRERDFLLVAGFFTLRALVSTVVSVAGPVILVGLGMSLGAAVATVALIGPAQVGIRLVQVFVGRNWTPLATTWFGALLLPACLLVPASGIGPPALGATVLAVGYGLSNGILTIARGTLPLFLFGPAGYATRIGQLALPVILAQAAAPVLSAPLIAADVPRLTLLVLFGVCALACGCLLPLRHR